MRRELTATPLVDTSLPGIGEEIEPKLPPVHAPPPDRRGSERPPNLMAYVWQASWRAQILPIILTLALMPFVYLWLVVPKEIINGALSQGTEARDLWGYEVLANRHLITITGIFLLLIIINNAFRFIINGIKINIGRKVITQLRFDLCFNIFRFDQSYYNRSSPVDLMIGATTELDSISDFITNSYIQPILLSGMLVTIYAFLFAEHPILGLVSLALLPPQILVISAFNRRKGAPTKPKGATPGLSAKLIETMQARQEIKLHGIQGYIIAIITDQLDRLAKAKATDSEKNNISGSFTLFCNQSTTFLFLLVGGLMVLNEQITLGSLVASISAFKEVPILSRDLLDHYRIMQGASRKFASIIDQFFPKNLIEAEQIYPPPQSFEPLSGELQAQGVTLTADGGATVLDHVSISATPGDRIAITGDDPVALDHLAHVLAHIIPPTRGRMLLDGQDLGSMHDGVAGARIGYVGPDSYLFATTIVDNLEIGVRQARPLRGSSVQAWAREASKVSQLAAFSPGNWTTYEVTGIGQAEGLRDHWLKVIDVVGAEPALYRQGLASVIDLSIYSVSEGTQFISEIMNARQRFTEQLEAEGAGTLVLRFDPERYNPYASVAENILFGAPAPGADGEGLISDSRVMTALERHGLLKPLIAAGYKMAFVVAEMLRDLPAHHPLRHRYAFLSEEDLSELTALLSRSSSATSDEITPKDQHTLLALVGQFIVEIHRLGLIDQAMQEDIVIVRAELQADLAGTMAGRIARFDPDAYNPFMSVEANVLFGKAAENVGHASARVTEILDGVIAETGLRQHLVRAVADLPITNDDSRITPATRMRLALARSMMKRPSLMVINQAFSSLEDSERAALATRLQDLSPKMIVIWLDTTAGRSGDFDRVWQLSGGRLGPVEDLVAQVQEEDQTAEADKGSKDKLADEVATLRSIPLFNSLSLAKLRLLALSADRVNFAPGTPLVREGDPADAAYVIIDGEAAVLPPGTMRLDPSRAVARVGANSFIGEMSLLAQTPRTSTVIAVDNVSVLRIGNDMFLDMMHQDGRLATTVVRAVMNRMLEREARNTADL